MQRTQGHAKDNDTITVKTFLWKGWWLLYGTDTLRKQRVISFLDLIILIATTRLANIHKRNTRFLCKKQFLSKLSIKKSYIIFSWPGWWNYYAVYGCTNDRRKPEKVTVMDHVGKLRWYSPKDQKDIFNVVLKCQCLL